MRRVKSDMRPVQPERRYLLVDVSRHGQVRHYVQLRKKLPKIRIKAAFGTAEFEAEVDAAIAAQIATSSLSLAVSMPATIMLVFSIFVGPAL